MPKTWTSYGVDANGDGVADPNNPLDAITSAARYLAASGAGSNLAHAIYAYNHAWWYVDEVLALARSYGLWVPKIRVTSWLDRMQARAGPSGRGNH